MIHLYVDLEVAEGRESHLLTAFTDVFRPAIRRQDGFVEVHLLRMREPAGNFTHRLLIAFASEEQRGRWVASDLHQQVWPEIEANLAGARYAARLYDVLD